MTIKTLLCGTALAVSAALALPAAASAQVLGIASANEPGAIFNSKAWGAALTQMQTTYKGQIDQATAKQNARQALLLQLDKNGDKQVDDAEVAANGAAMTQISTLDREIQQAAQPLDLAQAYVLDTIGQRYVTALQTVITSRKVSLVLSPEVFVYAPQNTDITAAIVAEIDRTLPTVPSVTPPAGWQPTQQSVILFQQWQEGQQRALQQRAAAAAGAPPAAGAAAPRPATATPARPATPTPATPARPGTQQPASR